MSDREVLHREFRGNEALSFTPHILNIDGENEWVENVLDLGDLIERKMGRDTSELYFEVVAELITTIVWGDEPEDDWGCEDCP